MERLRGEHDRTGLRAGEGADEQLEPRRERERLVRLWPAERNELFGRALPDSTSPCVTAPIETSATSGRPSDEGTAIAIGFVPVSRGPPSGCGSRRGEVAVTTATNPASASCRAQAPSTPVGKHDSATTSLARPGGSATNASHTAARVT